ncbi:MAG: hypothetical protein Q7V57_05760 [Actinomycetota bacterium]|nr:hypothetical protein [Actinomycetota bacterium]
MVTKTALNIDKEKVRRAAEVLGTKGTTATIDAALTEIIVREGRARLLDRMRTLTDEEAGAILHSWD